MVVFTCNNCGESLQKPKVEKHFSFSCRGSKNLTCVDCFKDFKGEEYVAHTKCVTENQRYGGKDYVEKAKKGEVKQESWMEMIKSILMHEVNITAGCRNLLNSICNFDNVPRKKQKFINFIKSSTGGRAPIVDIEGVWDLIEKHKRESERKRKLNENTEGEKKVKLDESLNGSEGEPQKKKKKNKRKENETVIEGNHKTENGIEGDISHKENVNELTIDGEQLKKNKKSKRKESTAINAEDNKTEDSNESISLKEEDTDTKKNKLEDENMKEVNNEGEKSKKKKKNKCKGNGTISIENDTSAVKEENDDLLTNGNQLIKESGNAGDQSKKKKKNKCKENIATSTVNDKTDNNNSKILDKEHFKKQKMKSLTNNAGKNYGVNSNVEVVEEEGSKNGVPESTDHINNKEQFSLVKEIENILTEKGSIPLIKLEKKILKKYKSLCGEGANLDKFSKKFNKKIKKIDRISVDNDVVKLKVE